ncbi:hypothetical protein AGMMS49950_03960 [Endomicrobiia bacterium]|nr:hypothetical protein AGMMS49950_03960 [Endomicrobiia bacterium]
MKKINATSKKRSITMKLKAILSVFVAFSLALSSCDKKNASLVTEGLLLQRK